MNRYGVAKNRGIWCGRLVSVPKWDHQIVNQGVVLQEYYSLIIEVEYVNSSKTVRDVSFVPVLIEKKKLEELGSLEEGDPFFVKGEWRAYNRASEQGKNKTVSFVKAYQMEKVEEMVKTRNKIEFIGRLATKLYKTKFGSDGKMEKDEKGRPVRILDENGKKIPWVRRDRENFTVNDYHIETVGYKKDESGDVLGVKYKEFVPCISYGAVAWKVANEIDLQDRVKASGYIRSRRKEGTPEYVYEAVITHIAPI